MTDTQTPEPTPAVAWCEHYAPAGECCPQPTAPASGEASPVEAAAEAIRNLVSDHPEIQAEGVLRAGLAGDWLERVLWDHRDLGLIRRYSDGVFRVCATCGNVPDMGRPAAHQAAAVVACATGVGL